jgi:hypothetical protein
MQRRFAIGGEAQLMHAPTLHLRYYMPIEVIADGFTHNAGAQTIAAGSIAAVKHIQIDKFGTMAGDFASRQPVGEPQVVANVGKFHDD